MFSLVAVSAELAEQLVAVETGGPDAVHQARTRVRRLRSILSVYRRAFDRDQTDKLRRRLKTLGSLLGDVRDLEVRATAIEDTLAVDTEPAVIDAVTSMAEEARADHERALATLLTTLRGRAARKLLADLLLFAAEPPLSKQGRTHPRKVARKGLTKAAHRVRPTGGSLPERHELRKNARRLRYAADAVADLFGREAVRLATAAEAVQDALGDHRDLILLAAHLRDRSASRRLDASTGAAVERLAAECERRAAECLHGLNERLDVIKHAA
jgi:CHAD domain-containing protein